MLIEKYKEKWSDDFAQIRKVLIDQLNGINVQIEHIGSTSVISLPAKPIIDIDIIYNKPADFERIKVTLEDLGYSHNGDQGIEGREVFKRINKLDHDTLNSIAHHLYVCKDDSNELKQHLLFRDYLINSADARKTYAKLKYDLAERANQNKKVYASLKETEARSFINECIKKQENEK